MRRVVPVGVELRLCRADDLPNLEWYGLFEHHRAVIREAFARQERGEVLMWLAVAGDLPVGQAWLDLRRAAPSAVVWAVRVFPCLRGAGLGSVLMRTAEALLRERGVARAELGVEKGNPGARRFYERLGYRLAGERVEAYDYVTPAGERHHIPLDEWLLAKDLGASTIPTRA